MNNIEEEDLKPGNQVKVVGINWDTDGEDAGLSENITITIPNGFEEGDSIVDVLSDEYGFCIFSYSHLESL